MCANLKEDCERKGEVVRLDRKFPLVELEDGARIRCEHATDLKKNGARRAAIGDIVSVRIPCAHEMGVIERIEERRTEFVRKDPVDRTLSQTLAANFDRVMIVHPIDRLNPKRIERELVLAHSTGADVMIVLTKKDLCKVSELDERIVLAQALAGTSVEVVAISNREATTIDGLRAYLREGTTSVLFGSSGAGKSTLINAIVGEEVCEVGGVREVDGKGRHTTVAREMLMLANGARIVDMPGVRGLGIWEAIDGINAAFADIVEFSANCKFRDCKHVNEPGCAVLAAVESDLLDVRRLESFRDLMAEQDKMDRRREQSTWKNK